MNGQYAHNIDAKGRLFIPTKLRDELGGTLHVTVGQDHCLSVYSDERWAAFMARLQALSYNEVKKLRALFAYAADCAPDSQGRILIPASRCGTLVVGVSAPIGTLVDQAAAGVLDGCRN